MQVQVVVPYAGACPHRARALEWVRGRWPWPVMVAPGRSPWRKAEAVMPAVERSSADVVVVADADVWCDGAEAAVRAVYNGQATWAVPHRGVHRLAEPGTAAVLAGDPWDRQPVAERPYPGIEGGGIVIARREILLDTPLDPRFLGWGQEDESWGAALRCLHGPAWRGDAPLIHLWHPPQARESRRRGSPEGWRLRRRYMRAQADPAAMRQLVTEAKHALSTPQPAVHDHEPHRVG